MPTFYNFTENGLVYSFDDVFVPADLFREGTLWAWGSGNGGRLGNAVTTNVSTPITTFAGGTNWKQIDVGFYITAAIKTDGTLWTWGNGSNGQLGNAAAIGTISTPVTTFSGGTNWKQVSAGQSHTAAIKTDGTLWTWGYASSGVLGNAVTTNTRVSTPVTTFAGGTNWKQVSAGNSNTAAIKTDGTLWTWGNGYSGILGNGVTIGNISTPITTFAGGTNWKQVSLSTDYINLVISDPNSGGAASVITAAAIKTDGTLWTWGYGREGQLGTGNNPRLTSTPVTTFAGGTNWKQVNCGFKHIVAIKTDGTLWTWGNGSNGRLGRPGSITGSSTPVTTFAGGTNWADTATTEPEDLYTLSAGENHTAAIKTDGTLWTWGSGVYAQLGNATLINTSTPITTFSGGTNWKQVSAGNFNTAAIKTDGTLWTWGNGSNGKLGNGVITGSISTPITTFAGGTNWKQVSFASGHTAAIKTDGTLWTWGFGFNGRLGNAVITATTSTPVTTFSGGTNWKQVSTGYQHTAAIKTDGTLWTWGSGNGGRLGNAVITGNISTPITTFSGGTNWKQVSAGSGSTAAIKTDGTLWTWGSGNGGRLGNAVTTNVSTPITTFAGGTNWKQVSCGGSHASAIKTDGTLWTWGNGSNGQLGNAVTTSIISTPVTTFAGGTNWKQVSAGQSHTFALSDDGISKILYGFGLNASLYYSGQLGISPFNPDWFPSTTFSGGTNWKQVNCGYDTTTAIKTDGTLWTWGNGSNGRLGNAVVTGNISTPVTTFAGGTNWKQVSGSFYNTVAATYDDPAI